MQLFPTNPVQTNPVQTNPVQTNPVQTIDAHTLKQWLDQNAVTLVDVREAGEYARGHLPGAQLVALSSFDPNQIAIDANKELVLYCQSGQRSGLAAQKLVQAGFQDVFHLGNGIGAWVRAGYPITVN